MTDAVPIALVYFGREVYNCSDIAVPAVGHKNHTKVMIEVYHRLL